LIISGYYLLTGILWILLVQFISDSFIKTIIITLAGVVFVYFFLWLIIMNAHTLLDKAELRMKATSFSLIYFLYLVVIFGTVYSITGVLDNASPQNNIIHSLDICVYYSIVTFTTLGYGDFYPVGAGRAVAAIQAITGFVVLGITASTAASVISKKTQG
jgi:hypothetical protein